MAVEIDLGKPGGAKQIADLLRGKTREGMKIAALETMRQLAVLTPVYTGRLRYSYFVTVGSPSLELPPPGEYQMPSLAERMNLGDFSISDTLYITNNVYYGVYVNNGTAKMAPRHFVERAVAAVVISLPRKLGNGFSAGVTFSGNHNPVAKVG